MFRFDDNFVVKSSISALSNLKKNTCEEGKQGMGYSSDFLVIGALSLFVDRN